jgi:protein O-GlcNAc transferase
VLRQEAGFASANTIARFLNDEAMQQSAKGGVILVDEASQLGTRDMNQLFAVAERMGARVVLVGDRRQHRSVTAGEPLKLLEASAGLRVAEVTEILRQQGDYKKAAEALSEGRIADSFSSAVRQVREAACDLLYYWEVGSDAMNYFLPFARLAPVQCTSHGSLTTTGVPAIDYFYSSSLIESENSGEHYSERLWRSRTLLMCQQRLRPVSPAWPAYFGLPDDRRLYGCLQNPLKLHPGFDDLLASILAADPLSTIVLLADDSGHAAVALRARFVRHTPASTERIVFVPRQKFADYYRLLQVCDVLLDPLHYGAGSSCYDVFSFNLPMVTLPTTLMPGRVALGFYRKMGFEELVASSPEDYVRKAVRVATDPDYRKHVMDSIAHRSDVVFNDVEAVREHERFFAEAFNQLC